MPCLAPLPVNALLILSVGTAGCTRHAGTKPGAIASDRFTKTGAFHKTLIRENM